MFLKDIVGAESEVLLYVREDLHPIEYNIDFEFELIGIKLNTIKILYVYLTYRKLIKH